MAAHVIVLEPEGLRIPADVADLERFRSWARSDDFPERGRIDYLAGEVNIDTSPEDVTTHGTPKAALVAGLHRVVVEEREIGMVLTDRCRLSSPSAGLSSEPDVLVVYDEAIASGRVRLIPRADATRGRFVEIEGPADLVVECVSDSSVNKDARVLPALYHKAGVREYWLVDARGERVAFTIHRYTPSAYQAQSAGADGFVTSALLGLRLRLRRQERAHGVVVYRLDAAPTSS